MKQCISIFVAACILFSISSPSFAIVGAEPQNEPTQTQEIYEENGLLSYFEKNDKWTINAIVRDSETIDFSLSYNNSTDTVYTATVSYRNLNIDEEDLYSSATWNRIRDFALTLMTPNIVAQNSLLPSSSAPITPYGNSNSRLVEKMRYIYGNDYRKSIASGYQSGATIVVYESFYVQVKFSHMRTSAAGCKLQAFATLLGVKYTLLGGFLGLVFGETVPTDTSIAVYDCYASTYRDGQVKGVTYYSTVHHIIHTAIEDLNSTQDPALDVNPSNDYYYPSQSVYNSTSKIIDETGAAYLR